MDRIENEEPEFFAFEEGSESVTEYLSIYLVMESLMVKCIPRYIPSNDPDNYIDFTVMIMFSHMNLIYMNLDIGQLDNPLNLYGNMLR